MTEPTTRQLSAESVSWRRGGRLVLDGVSVGGAPGAVVGLLGPNGSGKSSLLRLLAGLAAPDSGTVRFGDADLSSIRRRHIARRVALVEQSVHTEVDLTVLDIVDLGRIPHRSLLDPGSTADRAAVDRALAGTGIESLRNRRWHSLSGGERQRVQIARALAQEPECLLLDEPTNHLDIQHQLDVLELVAQLPVTSYVALHDLNLAAMFCDQVVILAEGRVVAAGRPADVITPDLVEHVYHVRVEVTIDDGVPAIKYSRRR